jgi:hypothetical protein
VNDENVLIVVMKIVKGHSKRIEMAQQSDGSETWGNGTFCC